MKIVFFAHSLASCWNHGNAHFLRGVATELILRGHEVTVFEPADGWSAANLVKSAGANALRDYQRAYPLLTSRMYLSDSIDLDWALRGADLVIVHESSDPKLVRDIGFHRLRTGGYALLFHDTHHRSVSSPADMVRYDLSNYDGVLAFGKVVKDLYLEKGWSRRAWTWHEAADIRVFHPLPSIVPTSDLVWIGNWGDEERTAEMHEFLIRPVKELGLEAAVYGVGYPEEALDALADAGIEYRGWLPNYRVPEVFASHRMTVHVPRGYYSRVLPGIPTIRPFEAMACGIPLISAPWRDSEMLFCGDQDYVTVADGEEMKQAMRWVLSNPDEAAKRASHGTETIRSRHTCAHRVDELLEVLVGLPKMQASML